MLQNKSARTSDWVARRANAPLFQLVKGVVLAYNALPISLNILRRSPHYYGHL